MEANGQELYPMPGYTGYLITKDARVWSEKSHKWLTLRVSTNGYTVVSLFTDRGIRTVCIHRLLLETFVGPCPEGMECRHLDGNKQNNDLSNLVWGTRQANASDRMEQGTYRAGNRGLTTWQVIWIRYLLSLRRFSQTKIAQMFNTNQPTVSNIKIGKYYSM